MRISDLVRRMALVALAILPPSAAAFYIAVFAKDGGEVASALLGVAGMLTLANLIQIAFLMRANRRLAGRQDDTRRQALALARCMRDLNQRMALVETDGPARSEGSAPTVQRRPAVAVQTPPRAPTPPPPTPVVADVPSEIRIVTLPHRRLAGIELTGGNDEASAFLRLTGSDETMDKLGLAHQRIVEGVPTGTFVLVTSERPLSASPDLITELEAAASHPRFCTTFLLGISQKSIRRGGVDEAAVLARLARAGIRFMLTEVGDFTLDPDALAACNITHVRISSRMLIERDEDSLALIARLEAGGIVLIASGADHARMVPELIERGIPLGCGAALDAGHTETHAMPWRAGHSRAGALSARAEDSIRYRAAG